MTRPYPALAVALAPVREALLTAARADAAQALAAADVAAASILATSQAGADRIRQEARAQGTANGTVAAAAERNQARRAARARVLSAERDAYQQLRGAARAAVARLADEPGYPRLRAAMAAAVARRLDPEATVSDAAGGGVIGQVPGRRVDYSLAGFADRAVDAMGELS